MHYRRYQVIKEGDRYAVKDSQTFEVAIYRPFTPLGLASAQRIAERLNAHFQTEVLVATA